MAGRGEKDRTDVRDRGSEVQSLQEYHRTSLDFPGKNECYFSDIRFILSRNRAASSIRTDASSPLTFRVME